MLELSRDKQEVIKSIDSENGLTRDNLREKIDALGWHGRLVNLLSVT